MNADIIKQLREAHAKLTPGIWTYSAERDRIVARETVNSAKFTSVAEFWTEDDMQFLLLARRYLPQLLDDAEELLALAQTDYRHEYD